MKKIVLCKREVEYKTTLEEIEKLQPGEIQNMDEFPEVIKEFNSEVEALEELKNYSSSRNYTEGFPSNFFTIEEFFVEIIEDDLVSREYAHWDDEISER